MSCVLRAVKELTNRFDFYKENIMCKAGAYVLSELESKVIKLVKDAAKLAEEKSFDISCKDGPSNIVTTNDIAVQHFLHKKLKELMPESEFLCEEEDMRNSGSEYVWVIDPIDGTMNYSRGIAECAVSVALVRRGKCLLGVVCDILSDNVFSATAEGGAKMNGKSISVSKSNFESGLLCTAMSLYNKEYARVCNEIIYEAYMQCNDVRRFGSCAIELCYLAAGKCDLYFEIRVFPWDYAASYLILKEAGGVLYGFGGQELTFDKPTALIGANNRENYEKLNDIVLKHLNKIPYKE